MRVVHFRQAFSILSETFIYNTVVEMDRQGVDCHVLALRTVDHHGRPFDRVSTVPLAPRWGPRRIAQKLAAFGTGWDREALARPMIRRGIAARLQELEPDAIHAHFGPDAALVAPVAAAMGIPLVATFYGYDFSVRRVLDRHRSDYHQLFNYASSVVGVSRYACERLAELGADESRLALVRLGVRIEDFPRRDPSSGHDGRSIRCIHPGRLVPKKSPVELVEAFAVAARALGPTVALSMTIVGDGPLRGDVLRRAAALGVSDRVVLAGALPHAEAMRLLARSQIYVQHSVTDREGDEEGQPVSLVEAAATGLPIVSTRHSGIPEVVLDGETGFLVAEHHVRAMGARIAALARDRALRAEFGAAARRHVEREFEVRRETNKLIVLLRRAVARGPRRWEDRDGALGGEGRRSTSKGTGLARGGSA